jgi:hypothetical protein
VATVHPNLHPRRRAARRHHPGRYAAVLAYLAALGLVVALSAPVLFTRGASGREGAAGALPARPAQLPSFIPGWAWEMNAWHETRGSERGPRPHGAPNPLPAWYWTWHAWRIQVERRAAP